MKLPALVVTPHSSGYIPADILADMLGQKFYSSQERQARAEWIFTEGDPYTEVLFHSPEAHNLQASISRFVVDLNRHREDTGNNGVIKLTDFEERPLYPAGFSLSESAREERLKRYWDGFHREIEEVMSAQGIRLLINGHSMQPTGPVIGPDAGQPRPAVCLMAGTDSTGKALADYASLPKNLALEVLALARKHFAVVVRGQNTKAITLGVPWSTDQLTHHYSHPARKQAVPGFGLEFNRALYLTYQDGKEFPDDGKIQALNSAFREFLAEVMTLV